MKPIPHLHQQFQSILLPAFVALIISFAFMGVIWGIHEWKNIPVGVLTRDPLAVMRAKIYTGFLSQAGIFFWAASAAICLFTAYLVHRISNPSRNICFLLASGCLSLLLGIDDAFLIHESFFPYYVGIPEWVLYLLYVVITLFWLIVFIPEILETEYLLLIAALFLFGMSVFLDVAKPGKIDPHFLEDGTKFTGIVFWLTYFTRMGRSVIYRQFAGTSAAKEAR